MNLRLSTVATGGGDLVCVRVGERLLGVRAGSNAVANGRWAGASMRDLLAGGGDALDLLHRVHAAAEDGDRRIPGDAFLDPDRVAFRAPVTDPRRIFCIGRNYPEHAREGGADVPEAPMIFLKPATSLAGHRETVRIPPSTRQVDWEGELAVVIGMPGRDIRPDLAWRHVAGLCVANDVTARDWQRRTSQFDAGKMFDGFAPMGPELVLTLSGREPDDVAGWRLRTHVGGRLMQDGLLGEMVFPVAELIADLSRAVELLPGDVVLTGTPAGVGYARTPPVFIGPGDVVEVSIDGIGRLENLFASLVTDGDD